MSEPKLTLTEILRRSPSGTTLYTEVMDSVVATYAKRAGVKVATARLLAIHPNTREVTDITRVTIL